MKPFARMVSALSGLLVGMGVAITAKTVSLLGFDNFGLGYVIGPGLVLAGLFRIMLQRRLMANRADDAAPGSPDAKGGNHGNAS